jgi:hypothetical protein
MLEFSIEKASGSCADTQGEQTITIYGAEGDYTDIGSDGRLVDTGTFIYTRLGPTEGKVQYQMTHAGTWKGGSVEEMLQFDTTTSGRFQGRVTFGDCSYQGTFKVRQ